VTKPAAPGREGAPVTALQGHVDMVCEKNRGQVHDFTRDPLTLVREGDWIRADGTTLGSDNGIGVAAALAVLASPDLAHGPLECLFTVDEERGLTGAVGCREGWLRAKYLLNLDGEDPGELTISCAGGLETHARTPLQRQAADEGAQALLLQVGGLKGGHSGVDIHLGRGNAIRVLARVLDALLEVPGTALAQLEGGSRRNVIPREASALLLAPAAQVPALRAAAAKVLGDVREGLGAFDPEVVLTLDPSTERPAQVLRPEEARRLVDLLRLLPHGPLALSPGIPGLVQTSTNLAVVACPGPEAEVVLSHRSSLACERDEAGASAAALARRFGCQVTHGGAYPGWKPEPHSDLVTLAQATFAGLAGKPANLRAIHAGLECGILGDKHPGLQMLSFGPHIQDAHSPQERVGIASVARFWDFLTALLENL
jgi:dipeptidase D